MEENKLITRDQILNSFSLARHNIYFNQIETCEERALIYQEALDFTLEIVNHTNEVVLPFTEAQLLENHTVLEHLLKNKVPLVYINDSKIASKGLVIHETFKNEPYLIEDIQRAYLEDFQYSHLTKKEKEANIVSVRNSNENPKIGRNEPCPCGSGKKYKQCCQKENN